MPTQVEEQEVREFLKRAEVRTMKKDLRALREVDALKEKEKIVKIKTFEEQQYEHEKIMAEKNKMEEVLEKNEVEERLAEKDLKDYATEQERQQIFLLESERFSLENQISDIDNKKDPALKLKKNEISIEKRGWQEKLDKILQEEKNAEGRQKLVQERAQASQIPEERKGLEQERWDFDKAIQEIEKKRWEAEKRIQDIDNEDKNLDGQSEQLAIEKNNLRDRALGIDKSLRDIYSGVIARVQEQRQGRAQEQKASLERLSEFKAGQKEKIQRQQWSRQRNILPPPPPIKNNNLIVPKK